MAESHRRLASPMDSRCSRPPGVFAEGQDVDLVQRLVCRVVDGAVADPGDAAAESLGCGVQPGPAPADLLEVSADDAANEAVTAAIPGGLGIEAVLPVGPFGTQLLLDELRWWSGVPPMMTRMSRARRESVISQNRTASQ